MGLGGDLCSSSDRLNSRADGPLTAPHLPLRHAIRRSCWKTINGVAVDLGGQASPFAAPIC